MFIRNVPLHVVGPSVRIVPLDRGRLRLPPDFRALFNRRVHISLLWTRDDIHGSWLAGAIICSSNDHLDDDLRIKERHLVGLKAQGVSKRERATRKSDVEPFVADWAATIDSDDRILVPRKLRSLFMSGRVHLTADVGSSSENSSGAVLVLPSRPLLGFFERLESQDRYTGFLYSGLWRPPFEHCLTPEVTIAPVADRSNAGEPEYLLHAATGVIGSGWQKPGKETGATYLSIMLHGTSRAKPWPLDLLQLRGRSHILTSSTQATNERVSTIAAAVPSPETDLPVVSFLPWDASRSGQIRRKRDQK